MIREVNILMSIFSFGKGTSVLIVYVYICTIH